MGDPTAAVQAVMDGLVASGEETGLQLAVYQHGKLVIDAWAGVTRRDGSTPIDGETMFTVYSCSKGITAAAMHLLAERGVIEYDAPIATYWPEFGKNGKEGVTIKHAMTHTAGLMQVPEGTTPADQADWALMCERMAEATPLWEPGSQLCYHAITYGWILGGVAERADGRPFGQIVAEDLAKPLGIDGLYMGVPESELGRIADLEQSPELLAPAPPPKIPNIGPADLMADSTLNSPETRRACLPAHGMVTNARSMARLYASLVGNGVDGVRLVPESRVAIGSKLQVQELDANSGLMGRFALGWGVGHAESAAGTRESAFGHGGYGGTYGGADPDYGLAIGFTKNYLTMGEVGQTSTYKVLNAAREALGVPN